MSLFKTIAAAALVTLACITAAGAQIRDRPTESPLPQQAAQPERSAPPRQTEAPAFLAPDLVSAIASGPLALLRGDDRQAAQHRMFYVVGFSMAADKACDFLSGATVRELLRKLASAIERANNGTSDTANDALLLHMSAGLKDGTAFMARNACSSVGGRQIARSLAALWESV